jgi:DNA-binding transcriptional ArsR family regulator
MAHPTRLTLVGLLRREGPLTATQAAEHVGQSPSSCSFHLRQLAKWGLVEEAPGGRGRERPWRATAELSNWQQAPVRGEAGEARTALDRVLAGRYLEQIDRWLQRRADEPERWLALSGLGDWTLYVTADELEEIERQVDAVVEPYLRRSVDREIRPADARPVLFIHALLPEAQP